MPCELALSTPWALAWCARGARRWQQNLPTFSVDNFGDNLRAWLDLATRIHMFFTLHKK
jgi:hypothetical protein